MPAVIPARCRLIVFQMGISVLEDIKGGKILFMQCRSVHFHDHRIGFTIQKLDRVMEGELDEIIDALIHYDQSMKMAGE